MIPDVKLNGASLFKAGWLRESIETPTPQSQSETVTVPGRNSPIRYTGALGDVSYEPRSFTITLSMLGTRTAFNRLVRDTVNRYAGQLCEVILSEEADLYMVGTIEAEPSYDPLTGKGQLVLSSSDGDSYRYHAAETVITMSGSGTAKLTNDFMPVVPSVTVTEETSLAWKIGDDSFRKTVSAGTWEFPELELKEGENTVTVTTEGTVTFRYREGCL